MPEDARQDLAINWREFEKIRFPKLGYKVEDLPETDSVLAGLVSQALSPKPQILVGEAPIVTAQLLTRVAITCQEHEGSKDAAELEAYVENMKRLECNLRRLESLRNNG